MKTLSILFLIVAVPFSIKAQLVPDFLISENAKQPSFALDKFDNMHVVWDSVGTDLYVKYAVFNSLGEKIKKSQTLSPFSTTDLPQIDIINNNALIVWRKITIYFNDYIYGISLDLNTDSIPSEEKLINDTYFDAYRWSPDVCALNDTL